MTVYDSIKKYSKIRGLSLQQVAEKSGLSKNMIYQYGKGKNPSLETLDKIAKTLKVDRNDLLVDASKEGSTSKIIPKEVDIKDAMKDDYTIMSYGGRQIPAEELEMIRRILDGGK